MNSTVCDPPMSHPAMRQPAKRMADEIDIQTSCHTISTGFTSLGIRITSTPATCKARSQMQPNGAILPHRWAEDMSENLMSSLSCNGRSMHMVLPILIGISEFLLNFGDC